MKKTIAKIRTIRYVATLWRLGKFGKWIEPENFKSVEFCGKKLLRRHESNPESLFCITAYTHNPNFASIETKDDIVRRILKSLETSN